jgi:hypothetical protein
MSPAENTILELTRALERVTEQRDRALGALGATRTVLSEALAIKAEPGAAMRLLASIRELHAAIDMAIKEVAS